jgi:hypothetical protein
LNHVSQHLWSVVSVTATVVTAVVINVVIQHYYRIGAWDARSQLAHRLAEIGMSMVLFSFVTALVGSYEKDPEHMVA